MGVPEGPEGGTRTPRRVRSGEERHSFSILGNAPEKFLKIKFEITYFLHFCKLK